MKTRGRFLLWPAIWAESCCVIMPLGSSWIPQNYLQTHGLICFSYELTCSCLFHTRRRVGTSESTQCQPLHLLPWPIKWRLKHAGSVCVQPGWISARSGGAFRTSHDGRPEQGDEAETTYGGEILQYQCLLNFQARKSSMAKSCFPRLELASRLCLQICHKPFQCCMLKEGCELSGWQKPNPVTLMVLRSSGLSGDKRYGVAGVCWRTYWWLNCIVFPIPDCKMIKVLIKICIL